MIIMRHAIIICAIRKQYHYYVIGCRYSCFCFRECFQIIPLIILFSSAFLFSSCWIYPDYKDYEIIDGIYFFEDYEQEFPDEIEEEEEEVGEVDE